MSGDKDPQVQDAVSCPNCGHQFELGPTAQKTPPRPKRFFRRFVVPTLILLVAVAFGVLAMALVGFRDGMQERALATQHQAEIHYNRGAVYLGCNQYRLAEAEFEEALRLVPNHPQAEESRRLAQVKQTVTPSPTPQPTATSTPTPPAPTPTPEVVVISAAEVLYEEALVQYRAKEWDQAIRTLEQLRTEDSQYQTSLVREMLFVSHKTYGTALEEQGSLEEAISHYDSALYLKRRDPEVEQMRQRADLYIKALGVWAVDWETVIVNLTALYALAPDYKDTSDRLYEACVTEAAKLTKKEQYCSAAELYEQAVEIDDTDSDIVRAEDDNRHLCQVRASLPLSTPQPNGQPLGTVHTGTLVVVCYDVHSNQYGICAQDAETNELVTWVPQAEQPALSTDGTTLAYRSTDPARPGLYTVALTVTAGSRLTITHQGTMTITVEADAQWPTWSPDGTQLAYSHYETENEAWFVYVAEVESGPPQRVLAGEWPAWGPTGMLALTSCGTETDCGIHIYDPVSGDLRRLTSSAQDRAAAWSPSGQEIAYMSDIGRSTNLYVVQVESGHVRQLTRNLFTDGMPVWAPDGQRIAYVTDRDDDWAIYVLDPALGEDNERILSLGAQSADWLRFHPIWVPPVLVLAPPS